MRDHRRYDLSVTRRDLVFPAVVLAATLAYFGILVPLTAGIVASQAGPSAGEATRASLNALARVLFCGVVWLILGGLRLVFMRVLLAVVTLACAYLLAMDAVRLLHAL